MGDSWEDGMREAGLLNACYAVALGSDDCEMFAAIADEDYPDPWAPLYAEDYNMPITKDDGTVKDENINEWSTIAAAFDPASTAAVYLGGIKYQFCNRDVQDEITVVLVKKVKGGAVICKTSNGYYIIGVYDEEKEQVVGNAIDALAAYAIYMTGC